jgi:hypothetical protein
VGDSPKKAELVRRKYLMRTRTRPGAGEEISFRGNLEKS